MTERILSLTKIALAIIGALATVFSCLIALIVLVNPTAAQRVIIEFYNPITPTPQVIIITQPVPSALSTSTLAPTNTSEVVVVTATPLPPTSPPQPTSLFQDNFDTGLSPAWQIVSGNPMVVNNLLTTDKDTWLTIGDNGWTNYTIEFEANAASCWMSAGYNTIGVRVQDTNNMIAWRWSVCESVWYIAENGNWKEVPNSKSDGVGDYAVVPVVITADGGQFTVYINGKKISSFYDTRFQQGKIALQIGKNSLFDNFLVREVQR
jgi:hypothetical protein